MEKIIFFGLVIPIFGFVLYLGGSAIMKGFKAKNENKSDTNKKGIDAYKCNKCGLWSTGDHCNNKECSEA